MLRLALVVVLVSSCAAGRHAPVAPRYDPAPGTVLEREVRTEAQMELRDVEITRNGKPRPELAELQLRMAPSFLPGGVETWSLADEVVRVENGRPAELVRSVRALRGGTGATAGWTEALDGTSSRLTPDGAPIEEAGRAIPFDLDLCAALPAAPVHVGASWRAKLSALELLSAGLDERWDDVACTCVGTKPGSGDGLAVIELALDDSRETTEPAEAVMTQPAELQPGAFREEARLTLAGELIWDLERHHAAALDVRTDLVIEVESRSAPDASGGPLSETRTTFALSTHTTQEIRSSGLAR
jgi:hypothetical protein